MAQVESLAERAAQQSVRACHLAERVAQQDARMSRGRPPRAQSRSCQGWPRPCLEPQTRRVY